MEYFEGSADNFGNLPENSQAQVDLSPPHSLPKVAFIGFINDCAEMHPIFNLANFAFHFVRTLTFIALFARTIISLLV